MSRPHAGSRPAGGAPAAGRAGLSATLMAAVRAEFRVEVLTIDPADPVFGGPPCTVAGCERTSRSQGLCVGHNQRWLRAGRPDLTSFLVTTAPALRGRAPLASCRVETCRNGRHAYGLCTAHEHVYARAGRPELATWLGQLPSVDPSVPREPCRVTYCDLWAQGSVPLCVTHASRWSQAGKPDVEQFARDYGDWTPRVEQIDLRRLGPQLRLEMQYVIQRRRDDAQIRTTPTLVQTVVHFLARSGATSLLDHTEQTWRDRFGPRGPNSGTSARALLLFGHRQIEQLTYGSGWDVEYPRDVWRLHNLGITEFHRHLRFDRIPQPWLRGLAKRWLRWRLGGGLSENAAGQSLAALVRFAVFLAAKGIDSLAQVDRPILERYLAEVHKALGGKSSHGTTIGYLGAFFQAIRRHRWDTSLPASAVFFTEDYPAPPQLLPRALAEHVMAQVEHPDNLARWHDPASRVVTLILIHTGLRIGDALQLPVDCIVRDTDGAPYLRYLNHKMKREALVPIDEELETEITRQQRRVTDRWPDTTPTLFPKTKANPDGRKPLASSTYRTALARWLTRCDIRDEHNQPAHLTPHQWRHTLGTRLINRDVPQEVVRKILDHTSPEMTAHYARLHDTTVRRHWEKARKVNAHGQEVTLDPDGPLAEAAWAKQRISRATQALPNGYCGLPVQKNCPHANACLTCPTFLTTAEFLPEHRRQHQQTLHIISAAEARGQQRLAEMNRRVAGNLEKIITALEEDSRQKDTVADAS